jgi:hypothetical protein
MTDARRDILSVTPFLLTPYRSLVEIGTNYAGAESERDMACGVLNFDMSTAGRRAIDLIVTDIQKNFNGKQWEQNGPKVILRVVQLMCGTKKVSMVSLNEYEYYSSTPSSALTLQDCTFLTLDLCFDIRNYSHNFS